MTRTCGLAGFVAAFALAACLQATPSAEAATAPLNRTPDGRPLKLTFAEEFDTFRPYRNGKGRWRTWLRNGPGTGFEERTLASNKELQLYVDPDWRPAGEGPPIGLNPFAVRNGVLEITAQPTPVHVKGRLQDYRYVSGMITTEPSFNQLYGYFEMRAKLPRGKGVWPAFWLLPADQTWPPEIDVMESIGDPSKVYFTLHSNHPREPGGGEARVAPNEFHTYAVSWDKDRVIWFIDGREVMRRPTPPDMHKPMFMLANVALGGDWAGQPDATTPFPAKFSIDYIRAYRFAP